jgi:hypothetical protein
MYNHSLSPFNHHFQVVIRLLVSMYCQPEIQSWRESRRFVTCRSLYPGRFDDRRSTLAEGHGDFTIWTMSSWDLGWYGTILEWNKIWILPWDFNDFNGKTMMSSMMFTMRCWWILLGFPTIFRFCTLLPRLQGEIHGVQGLVPWNLLMTIVI